MKYTNRQAGSCRGNKVYPVAVFILVLFYRLSPVTAQMAPLQASIQPSTWSKEPDFLLSWKTQVDFISFEILRDKTVDNQPTGENWEIIGSISPFPIKVLEGPGEYELWFRGRKLDGQPGSMSKLSLYYDPSPPFPPDSLNVTPYPKNPLKIAVSWQAPADEGSGVVSYRARLDGDLVENVKSPWTLTVPEGFHTFEVWAVDAAGNESLPATAVYTPHPQVQQEETGSAKLPLNLNFGGNITVTSRWVGGSDNIDGYPAGSDLTNSELINATGTVENINVRVDVQSFPPSPATYVFEVGGKEMAARYGDLTTGFSEAEFISFSKQTHGGVELQGNFKQLGFKALLSQSKSLSRSIAFQGNGTKGPYSLQSINVVEGSEKVYLTRPNQLEVQISATKPGDVEVDQNVVTYILDNFSGNITFSQIVQSDWQIRVTFDYALEFLQRTGDIVGLQTFKAIDSKNTVRLTFLQETADRGGNISTAYLTDPPILSEKSGNKCDVILRKEYPLKNWPLVDLSETIFVNNNQYKTRRTKANENGDYNIDYQRGAVRFFCDKELTPPGGKSTVDTISISYNYVIANSQCANLCSTNGPDPACGANQNTIPCQGGQTDYSIPFSVKDVRFVRVLKNGVILSPEKIDEIDADYTFDSTVAPTKIILTQPAIQTDTVFVEYRLPPEFSEETTQAKRRVFDLVHTTLLPYNVKVNWEIAQSISDRESFGSRCGPVPVNGNNVDSSFPLRDQVQPQCGTIGPVVPGSERILKNGQPLTSGSGSSGNYFFDYNSATLHLFEIPKNTDVLSVEFRHFPPGKPVGGSLEEVKGTAFKINVSGSIQRLNVNTFFRKVEPLYLPVGAQNPQDEDRTIGANFTLPVNKELSMNGGFSSQKNPVTDPTTLTPTGQVFSSKSVNTGFMLNLYKLPTLNANFSRSITRDNLIPHKQDAVTSTSTLSSGYSFWKIKTNLSFGKTDSSSKIATGSFSNSKTYGVGIEFNPYQKLTVTHTFQRSDVQSTAQSLSTKTRSLANRTGLNIRISPTFRLNGTLDLQTVKNSQQLIPYRRQTITTNLTTQPVDIDKWRIKGNPVALSYSSLLYSLDKNPSETPARTSTTTVFSHQITLIPGILTFTNSFSKFNVSLANGTGSNSSSINATSVFSPKDKRNLRFTVGTSKQKTTSKSLAAAGIILPTTSANQSYSLENSLSLSRLMLLTTHLDLTKTTSLSTPSSKVVRPWFSLNYTLGAKISTTLRYQLEKQSVQNFSRKRQDFILNFDYRLTQQSIFSLEWKYVSSQTKELIPSVSPAFSGYLVTAKMDINL